MAEENFATGFFTGLANQLNTDISARYQKADDFFEEQVKLARTKGLENRTRVQTQVGQYTSLAKQLQQIGVPKNVIMAVANQDPASLEGFAETVNKARASGVALDESFFNNLVEMSRDFKAPDEDYDTFFRRVFEPITANAKADPEAFQRDQKGSIWATLMGHNAMDRAQARLGRTEIIDGLTAEQLLAYGDNQVPNKPLGEDLVVTLDPSAIPKNSDLSLSDLKFIGSEVDTAIGTAMNELANTGGFDGNTPEGLQALRDAAKQKALEGLERAYGDRPEVMKEIYKRLGITPQEAGGEITTSELPPDMEDLNDAGIGVATNSGTTPPPNTFTTGPFTAPRADAPAAPAPTVPEQPADPMVSEQVRREEAAAYADKAIDPLVDSDLFTIELQGTKYTYDYPYDAVSSTYTDEKGNKIRLLNSEVRKYIRG